MFSIVLKASLMNGRDKKPKGSLNLIKKVPKLNSNIDTNVGLVEETLDDFLKKYEPKIIFIHMDLDLY